MSDKVSVLLVI